MCSALTWTPDSHLTPSILMAKPSLPSTSFKHLTNQVLLFTASSLSCCLCHNSAFKIHITFSTCHPQTLRMKMCFASTKAASTHPTTSWSTSATSTICPRYTSVAAVTKSSLDLICLIWDVGSVQKSCSFGAFVRTPAWKHPVRWLLQIRDRLAFSALLEIFKFAVSFPALSLLSGNVLWEEISSNFTPHWSLFVLSHMTW